MFKDAAHARCIGCASDFQIPSWLATWNPQLVINTKNYTPAAVERRQPEQRGLGFGLRLLCASPAPELIISRAFVAHTPRRAPRLPGPVSGEGV